MGGQSFDVTMSYFDSPSFILDWIVHLRGPSWICLSIQRHVYNMLGVFLLDIIIARALRVRVRQIQSGG